MSPAPGPGSGSGSGMSHAMGYQVPGSRLIHQAERPDNARLTVRRRVPDGQLPAQPQRPGQIPQAGHLLLAAEPSWHVEMNQRARADPGGDLDLPVRGGQRARQPELAQDRGHAQDEQRLGLVRPQAAQREPVAVHQPAAATRSRLGDDRDTRRAQRRQVPVHGPDADPEFVGERPRGRRAPRLEQQGQREQPVGTHERKVTPLSLTQDVSDSGVTSAR